MSTMEKDRVTEDESASPEEQQPVAPRRSKKTRKSKKSKSSSGPLDQLPVGDVLGDGGPVGQVKDTVGGLTGGLLGGQDQQQQGGGGGKSDTLRLRLDLNLEVEIQLKARIHGDLELALLTG